MAGELHLAHVLPADIEDARKTVNTWLEHRGLRQFRPLCVTQPAAFIDPKELRGSAKNACLRGIIHIGLVSGQEIGILVAAFHRPPETPRERDVAALLADLKIPTFCGDLTDASSIRNFLDSCNLDYRFSPSFRKVTNMSEARLMRTVKYALGIWADADILDGHSPQIRNFLVDGIELNKKRFRVYEEVAVGEIIKSLPGTPYERFSAFRVDILVASPPPLSTPLFVVEFDGLHHADHTQRKKDKERDDLFVQNLVPVLRISHKNPQSSRFQDEINSTTGAYFFDLISRISWVVENERVGKAKALHGLKERELRELDRLVSAFRKEHSVIQIPSEEIAKILSEARITLAEDYDWVYGEFQVDDHLDALEWQEGQKPSSYRSLSECVHPDNEIEVLTEGSIETGLRVEIKTSFKCPIVVPEFGPFYAQLKSPDVFAKKLDTLPREAAIATALSWADDECKKFLYGVE